MTLVALVFVQFLFGALPVATKIVLQHLSPLGLMVIRTGCAAALFATAVRLERGRVPRVQSSTAFASPLHRKAHVFSMALCGASLNQYLLFLGIEAGSAVIAAIVVPAIPLFTVLLAALSGRESPHPLKLAASGIGILGVGLLLSPSLSENFTSTSQSSGVLFTQGSAALSVLYCALSALLSAAFLVFSGPLVQEMGPRRMLLECYFYGFLLSVMLWLWHDPVALELARAATGSATLPTNFWMALIFIVVGPTALANFLNMWALNRVAPTTVGGFVFLQTLVGVVLGVTLLGEDLTRLQIVASLCIGMSLALVTWVAWREAQQRANDTLSTLPARPEAQQKF